MTDRKIVEAAKALAKLAHEKQKPVLFNMDIYFELITGEGRSTKHDDLFGKTKDFTDLERALIDEKIAGEDVLRYKRCEFTAQLENAFFLIEVCNIESCMLVQIGGTNEFPTLGEANVYMVMIVPKEENCFVLDL